MDAFLPGENIDKKNDCVKTLAIMLCSLRRWI